MVYKISQFWLFSLACVFCGANTLKDNFELLGGNYYENFNVRSNGKACDVYKDLLKSGRKEFGMTTAKVNLNWFFQMIDASAKPMHSILEGNFVNYGGYDQCMGIDELTSFGRVKGKYCSGALEVNLTMPSKLTLPIRLAMCIPHTCDINEDEKSIGLNLKKCQTKDDFIFDSLDWTITSIFLVFFGIIILSTIYDVFLLQTEQKARSPALTAFSLFTNGRKLFAVTQNSEQVSCLNGIRAISMIWIIAGHRFANMAIIAVDNKMYLADWIVSMKSFFIPGARLAVDTFFFLSAFLLSYNCLKGIQKNPLTLQKLPMFYIHRLFRIMPALLAVFLLDISIVWRLADGPQIPLARALHADNCKKYWWSYFLFVQNYVNPDDLCLVPTWYLSADMQMFFLSPLLIIPLTQLRLKGKRVHSYILCATMAVICILISMIVDLTIRDLQKNDYATHPRLGLYILGILMGMVFVDYKNSEIKISQILNLAMWGLTLGVMLTVVLCSHDIEFFPERLKNNMFFTFTRPIWALGLSWIVFACHKGWGGPINWLLSKSINQIMTRLTFSMYLLHNIIINASSGGTKVTLHFDTVISTYLFCGDYVFTLLLAVLWVLCFESPMMVLEKVIFGKGGAKKDTSKKSNQEA